YDGETAQEAGIVRIDSKKIIFDPEDRIMSYRQCLDALADKQFDLVHIHTPFAAHYAGLRIAKNLGVPVILTYHTYFEEYFHHYIPFLPRTVTRYVARRV